ncbi:Probable L-type lectin-domain containing receptor kinase II.1 [Prunus dulcis]|uniref:Probable L-type lectin-domain containing receptor kinase II.1 n=1 Tax=Prunus dulcis TaxID=3755 RepID=A0A4Y1RCM9_PRUDU|nr:Probable L-type lectin-domain containing receptor kinase II.1 [Prunus dulcis]
MLKCNSLVGAMRKENSYLSTSLASGLLYLHEEWEQCVLYRDIKSSNIMLASNFNPKFGDFGLARLVDHEKQPETTRNVAGTRVESARNQIVENTNAHS